MCIRVVWVDYIGVVSLALRITTHDAVRDSGVRRACLCDEWVKYINVVSIALRTTMYDA